MSSKVFTVGKNAYPTDVGEFITNGLGISALTDVSDATFWATGAVPNNVQGSLSFAEDLAAQIPWNSTLNTVRFDLRVSSGIGGSFVDFVAYVKKISTGQKIFMGDLTFAPLSPLTFQAVFPSAAPASPWTFNLLYTDQAFGCSANHVLSSTGGLRWYRGFITATFTLPTPVVTTGPTAEVGGRTATVTGTARANHTFNTVGTDGYPVTISVQWGTTTAYGNTATLGEVTGNTVVNFSRTLTGLTPNTLYHYRLRAIDVDNTVNGLDATFTTGASDPILMSL